MKEMIRQGIQMRDKKKLYARYTARAMVKAGKLIKRKCEFCPNTQNLDLHHTDYEKPREVMILCRSCHKLLHGAMRRALQEEHT